MKSLFNTSHNLDETTLLLLREDAIIADHQAALTDRQWNIIQQHNWINLWLPKSLHGNDHSFTDVLNLLYQLAYTDGSVGWTVTLISGANWFAGFIENAPQVFRSRKNVWTGSGQAGGILTPSEGGYLLNGQWRYATGIEKATHITFNAVIKDTDHVIAGYLLPEQVNILKTWNKMGMRATGTHDFEIKNVWIDRAQLFTINHRSPTIPLPVFKIPFLIMAMATLAVNYMGMATHFLDEALHLASLKRKETLETLIHQADQIFEQHELIFTGQVKQIWELVLNNIPIPEELEAAFVRDTKMMIGALYQQVQQIFPHIGMAGVELNSMINLIWRDLHTASQHAMWRR